MKPLWWDEALEDAWQVAHTVSGMSAANLWNLWHLTGQSARLPHGAIVEVGCGTGGSSYMIAKRAQIEGIKDHIYFCDTFKGLVKANAEIDEHKNGEMATAKLVESADVSVDIEINPSFVNGLMKHGGIENYTVIEGVFPDCLIRDLGPIRFAHIDVDVYQSAKDSFEYIWPNVVPGGIVVMDDYGVKDCPGITRYVHEVMETGLLTICLQTCQAVFIK